MAQQAPVLDFRAVDDVAFAAERGKLGNIPPTLRLVANRLGPLLETLHLEQSGLLPPNPQWIDFDALTDLRSAIIAGKATWSSEGNLRANMMRLTPQPMSNEWTAFAMEAKRTAVFAGF
ncbi:MAG TPA: hypothetical protein PKC48_11175, partial [Sphingorhabdus sp.]|nr:hypothetical protein [Sphingorhabdus sp.]